MTGALQFKNSYAINAENKTILENLILHLKCRQQSLQIDNHKPFTIDQHKVSSPAFFPSFLTCGQSSIFGSLTEIFLFFKGYTGIFQDCVFMSV